MHFAWSAERVWTVTWRCPSEWRGAHNGPLATSVRRCVSSAQGFWLLCESGAARRAALHTPIPTLHARLHPARLALRQHSCCPPWPVPSREPPSSWTMASTSWAWQWTRPRCSAQTRMLVSSVSMNHDNQLSCMHWARGSPERAGRLLAAVGG